MIKLILPFTLAFLQDILGKTMEIGNTLESAAKIVSGMGQEFTNTFEVLGNIKEGFQDVLKHNLEDGLIQNLCYSVLCGGFMLLKCCYANLKKTIQEMEKEELPKRLHPYVREIRNYFESMEKKLQELDDIASEIWTTASTFLKDFALNIYHVLNELYNLSLPRCHNATSAFERRLKG